MFRPVDFEDNPLVLNGIREGLRMFRQIRKLLLFDRHPDGVASVSLCPFDTHRKPLTVFKNLMGGGLVAGRSPLKHGMGLQINRWRRPPAKERKG